MLQNAGSGVVILFFIFLAAAQTVSAHSMFLQSSRYELKDGKASPLFFCYGHYFPVADGVRAKKLKQVIVTNPKGEQQQIVIRNETSLHSYLVSYNMPGTWMLTAETNPGFYTVFIDKKGRERHTIKSMAKVKDRAETIKTSLYSKQYAKAYVACGKPQKHVFKRAGLALELVPRTDLFAMKPGDTLELDIYRDGALYEGEGKWDATYNGFSTQAEDMFHPRVKIKGSRLTINIPNAGRWFVRYFIKVDAPESESEKYLQMKQTATLTFQVDNPRIRPKTSH